MRKLLFIFTFFISFFTFSQNKYPQDYFRQPLDIPILLSGNFGELRGSHFHTATDIKTQQRQGLPVHAAADGYISRINIQHYGYGKAIYIQHPNGYTTVYGHLQQFAPKIQEYIKTLEYKKESYQVETFPSKEMFPVKKGDLIAYSGDTGSSGGPHVHFEIRDAGQHPMNPLLFGIDVADHQAPTLLGVYGYALTDSSQIDQSNKTQKIHLNKQANGSYVADKLYADGTIGFGINTFDRQDNTYNKNGAYRIEMLVNGQLYFKYEFNKLSFAEGKMVNTLIDYEKYIDDNERIQKLFLSPGNRISTIYDKTVNKGEITIQEGMSYNVEIKICDFKNNTTTVEIPIEGKKQPITSFKDKLVTDYFLKANRDNMYKIGTASIYFPANTFYEDQYLDLKADKNDKHTVMVHHKETAVAKSYNLTFDVSDIPTSERKQLFIANLSQRGTPSYETTYKKGINFSTRTSDLGTFTIMKDSVAPKIIPHNFKDQQWVSNLSDLKIKISDDLSGIKSYNAYINGKWILTEYEYKDNMLTYDFSDIDFKESELHLKVVVKDNVGNTNIYKATIFRKN